GLFSDKKEAKINRSNKEGKSVNSPQITGDGSNITINYNQNNYYNAHQSYSSNKVSSPNAIVKNEKKNQKEELEKEKTAKQNQAESREQSTEKDKEMPRQEFERLLMRIKFIAFGIMGNIE